MGPLLSSGGPAMASELGQLRDDSLKIALNPCTPRVRCETRERRRLCIPRMEGVSRNEPTGTRSIAQTFGRFSIRALAAWRRVDRFTVAHFTDGGTGKKTNTVSKRCKEYARNCGEFS